MVNVSTWSMFQYGQCFNAIDFFGIVDVWATGYVARRHGYCFSEINVFSWSMFEVPQRKSNLSNTIFKTRQQVSNLKRTSGNFMIKNRLPIAKLTGPLSQSTLVQSMF